MSALALLFALGLAPQAPDAEATVGAPRFELLAQEIDGELWISLSADEAPLRGVLAEIARRADLELEGFEQVSRTALVTAELRHRPLRQVLARVLGSFGLRAETRVGTLVVREASPLRSSPDELREQALIAYLGAQREHADHPAAAGAILSQARIEEKRGNLAAARAHCEVLVERHPGSEHVPGALLLAARLAEGEQSWALAAQKLADLLRLERAHPHEAEGRLALARCTTRLGDPERALHMLEALEGIAPAVELAEVQARNLVRARALVGAGRPRQALTVLAETEAWGPMTAGRAEACEVRAMALEAAGEPGDASRAWLAFADEGAPSERPRALENAARAALAAGDELAVLFIARLAEGSGGAEVLEAAAREARARLGLEGEELSGVGPTQRLARAERLLSDGLVAEARAVLTSLYSGRRAFSPPALVRWLLAYGRALEREAGVDTALAVFREVLPELAGAEDRRALYIAAGEMLERAERVDEAIEAYRGRL